MSNELSAVQEQIKSISEHRTIAHETEKEGIGEGLRTSKLQIQDGELESRCVEKQKESQSIVNEARMENDEVTGEAADSANFVHLATVSQLVNTDGHKGTSEIEGGSATIRDIDTASNQPANIIENNVTGRLASATVEVDNNNQCEFIMVPTSQEIINEEAATEQSQQEVNQNESNIQIPEVIEEKLVPETISVANNAPDAFDLRSNLHSVCVENEAKRENPLSSPESEVIARKANEVTVKVTPDESIMASVTPSKLASAAKQLTDGSAIHVAELSIESPVIPSERPPSIETVIGSVKISTSFSDIDDKETMTSAEETIDTAATVSDENIPSLADVVQEIVEVELEIGESSLAEEAVMIDESINEREANTDISENIQNAYVSETQPDDGNLKEYRVVLKEEYEANKKNPTGSHVTEHDAGEEATSAISGEMKAEDQSATPKEDRSPAGTQVELKQFDKKEIPTRETVIEEMSIQIANGEFAKAIEILREYKGHTDHNDMIFEENESDILMVLFANHLMKNRTSVFALTNSLEGLADVCDELSECMAALLAYICTENDNKSRE